MTLQRNLNTALGTWRTTSLQRGQEVGDVVPGMPVQTSTQPLLVKEMGNETDGATEDEKTVEDTHAEVVLSLLWREGAAVAQQVDEANSDAAVDVEDEVVLALDTALFFHPRREDNQSLAFWTNKAQTSLAGVGSAGP